MIKKTLKYWVVGKDNGAVAISAIITEQSHRGNEFGRGHNVFIASNGLTLLSDAKPQVKYSKYGDMIAVYTWGNSRGLLDSEVLEFTKKEYFDRFVEALTEYNSLDWNEN